jgi:hypothetical protein
MAGRAYGAGPIGAWLPHMTDTSVTDNVRPLPVKARRTDNTAALRQRRHRAKRKPGLPASATTIARVSQSGKPSKINADVTAVLGHAPDVTAAAAQSYRVPWAVWPLAGTTVGLMAVSLTHLSDGVTQLTTIPSWQAWAMAVGIDCMLISVALAQLTSPPDVKRDIAIVARCMEVGTLIMSAGLNALAFTGGAFDAAHWAQVAFGCFVPAAISGATYILARLTRR